MPARSRKQQQYMAMALHGKAPMPSGMSRSQARDFAETSTSNLPSHVASRSPMRRHKKR